MIPASPRRALTGAAIAALVVGSLALTAPAFADASPSAAAPALSFPAAGETVATDADITFRWTASAGATEYHFEAASDANFAGQIGSGLQVTTGTSISFHTPGSDSSAYWRVTAVGPNGSAVSETRLVRFAAQAPNASVGTPVTITAPPAGTGASTVAPPASSGASAGAASSAGTAAAPAVTTTSPAVVAQDSAADTASGDVTTQSAGTNSTTTDTAAVDTASRRAPVSTSLDTERTGATATDPIVVAMLSGLGVALLLVAGIRLLVLRRRA